MWELVWVCDLAGSRIGGMGDGCGCGCGCGCECECDGLMNRSKSMRGG